ncbi:replication protein A 70 kDa DNA-binding subunit [Bacillus rossius redtenbacheri]|uniref:replication protein A 70 kDa DNA-binding subunit n=1 Tax=Bacillus rossius redtenbacheri TaxID=93214 RepID=UPI002FDD73EA
MSYKLTEGALATIMRGGNVENPVVQILGHKRMGAEGVGERFRLLVSDGRHLNSFAMLATQLNAKVTSGELEDFTVVQIRRHITSMINNTGKGEKRVMIILDLTVLTPGSEVGTKLGNPIPFTDTSAATTPAPSGARPAQARTPTAPTRPMGVSGGNVSRVGGTGSPAGGERTVPISAVSPYSNAGIKARVTLKTPIKTYSNARGEGKLFSLTLTDESGEIRATGFNDAVDKLYDQLEVNQVYVFKGFTVKAANKQFSNIKHEYEITFNHGTAVTPCEDDKDIPTTSFNFVPINKLAEADGNTIVDVIGVCKSAGDVNTFVARTTNREVKKRDITLVDQSNTAVTVSLWGAQAEEFDGSLQPVVAIKCGKINDFGGGRSVSLMQTSALQVNPDIPEAHRLRGWFDNYGAHQETTSISTRSAGSSGGGTDGEWITLQTADESDLGAKDVADYFNCKATIVMIRTENTTYQACPGPDCNKKVINNGNGMYRCEKCNCEYPNFKHRLLLTMCISDWTSSQWVTCFQETGEEILGMTSQEVGVAHESDPALYESIFKNATFKTFVFRLRAKMEVYNDERRLKMNVMQAKPVDLRELNNRLLENIKALSGVGSKQSV